MDRKKLDRTIEEYAADYDARNMRTEGFEEKNKCASENAEKV
jgi:hypothetical protein